MKVKRDGELLIMSAPEEPIDGKKFKRFLGGIGWPDPTRQKQFALYWLFVLAEREDGRFLALEEYSGQLPDLAEAAVDAKDRLLIKTFYVNQEGHESDVRFLRSFNGLTHYEQVKGFDDRWKPKKPAFCQNFRDFETVAPVVDVGDQIRTSLEYGRQQIEKLNRLGRFEVMSSCHGTQWFMRQSPPINSYITHPVLQAVVWTILKADRPEHKPTLSRQGPGYWNLKR